MACDTQQMKELKVVPSICNLGNGVSRMRTSLENKSARKDFPQVNTNVLEQEAHVLLALDHPNIVKYLGMGTGKNNTGSLVLEHMEDNLHNVVERRMEVLRRKMKKKKLLLPTKSPRSRLLEDICDTAEPPFQVLEAMEIMLQITTAMDYLHAHGVAHGDLAPRNMFVSNSTSSGGQPLMVKVGDFGLVETKTKTRVKNNFNMVLRCNHHVDVLRWKAPELLAKLPPHVEYSDNGVFSDEAYDDGESDFKGSAMARADVYSFALTCVYLIGGEIHVHQKMSVANLRRKIMHGFRPDLPRTCPEHLTRLIQSCWDPEPSRRPSFSHISTYLKAVLAWIGDALFLDECEL